MLLILQVRKARVCYVKQTTARFAWLWQRYPSHFIEMIVGNEGSISP